MKNVVLIEMDADRDGEAVCWNECYCSEECAVELRGKSGVLLLLPIDKAWERVALAHPYGQRTWVCSCCGDSLASTVRDYISSVVASMLRPVDT